MPILKITERGWPGHFICADQCVYRRNTLIEYGNKRVIVSTVGNRRDDKGVIQIVGLDRYYETMAFRAKKANGYWEIDVSKQVDVTDWRIPTITDDVDTRADQMHENAILEISAKLSANSKLR